MLGPRTEPHLNSAVVWLPWQAGCFLSAGFTGADQAQPDRHAYRLNGPGGWLIVVLQTHVDTWKIAVQHGTAAAAPSSPVLRPAGLEDRKQTQRISGVFWLNDLAVALAVARRVGLVGLSGLQAREERRWLALAVWAAQ